jgi:hypothetical protein
MNQNVFQPPQKQMYQPNPNQGGGGAPANFAFGGGTATTEIEGPDEPENQDAHEPDDLARMSFLIHAAKMMISFAKSNPSCGSTQMGKSYLLNTFPNLPLRIDYNGHAEMRYSLSPAQKTSVDGWIDQLYKTMNHEVTSPDGRKFRVSQYFEHKKVQAWQFMSQGFKMVGMLNLGAKWNTMSAGSQNAMWRYMELLLKDARQFVGNKNLENFIPKEMRSELEGLMAKSGGVSADNPMGISPQDAQAFMQSMAKKPEVMQGFMSKMFGGDPAATKQMFQSMQDVTGGNFGDLPQMMQQMIGGGGVSK